MTLSLCDLDVQLVSLGAELYPLMFVNAYDYTAR